MPMPELFSLSLVKAAQRSLVQSLDMVYRTKGVHIALISVGSYVAPSQKNCNPENIAKKTWELFEQKKEDWTGEIEIEE
jgi:hypothetical protein